MKFNLETRVEKLENGSLGIRHFLNGEPDPNAIVPDRNQVEFLIAKGDLTGTFESIVEQLAQELHDMRMKTMETLFGGAE